MDILGYPGRDILVVPRISGQGRRGRSQDVPDILGTSWSLQPPWFQSSPKFVTMDILGTTGYPRNN